MDNIYMPSKAALLLVVIIISLIFVLHQGTSFKSVDYSSNNQPDKNADSDKNKISSQSDMQPNVIIGNVLTQEKASEPQKVLGEKISDGFNGQVTGGAPTSSGGSYGGTRTDLTPPTQSYAPPSEEIPQPQSDTSAIGVANE